MRKTKKCIAGYFAPLFFAFRVPYFAFCILRQGWHSRKNSKDFVIYFFAALIKHEIRMKYEKCIVSVLCFVVFREKHAQNAKCEKCIAGLTIAFYLMSCYLCW